MRVPEDYDWRGNFRELLNFAARFAVVCLDDGVITAESVLAVLKREQGGISVAELLSAGQSNAGSADKTVDDFSMTSDLITVTFDPKSDDLDTIYLKAAGCIFRHIISEHNGIMRSAAQALGVNHSTISRILEKYNRIYYQKPFHVRRKMAAKCAVATAA